MKKTTGNTSTSCGKKISLGGFSYRKSYYLIHPWKWFKDLKILAKNAHHRMRYGYAWIDLWNMDDYLGQLIPNMLEMLAEKAYAYPGTDEFQEYEDWIKYLKDLSAEFRLAMDEKTPEEQRKILRKKVFTELAAIWPHLWD